MTAVFMKSVNRPFAKILLCWQGGYMMMMMTMMMVVMMMVMVM